MNVDADAAPDFVVFNDSTSELTWFINTTDVCGIGVTVDTVTSSLFRGLGIDTVDIDADQDDDLVVADPELALWLNTGGAFAAPTTIDMVSFDSFVLTADLDDDTLGADGDLVWYENLGNGSRPGCGACGQPPRRVVAPSLARLLRLDRAAAR